MANGKGGLFDQSSVDFSRSAGCSERRAFDRGFALDVTDHVHAPMCLNHQKCFRIKSVKCQTRKREYQITLVKLVKNVILT